jgi:Tol biopolymer transport system component
VVLWLTGCDGKTTPTDLGSLAQAPDVETSDASISPAPATATLNGVVNPHGTATEALFEWGLNAGSLSRQTAVQAVSGTAPQTMSATIDSLNPATTYYYRAVARNEMGTRHGRTLSFVTLSSLPPPGGVRGRLAFVRAGDIYIYDPTNESTVQLTSGGHYGHPAWSPDGGRIAFAQQDPSPVRSYVINADGSGRQLVGEGGSPAWSPDGRRLALAGRRDGQGAILVKSMDDPNQPVVRIGFDRGYHDFPAWSPDGTRIAFVSDWTAFDFAYDVYIANADGSGEVEQVTDGFFGNQKNWPSYTIYAQPSWSPDGRSLAVVACHEWQYDSCAISRVGVMAVDGSGFQLLANATGFARPGWAPDGSAVVFSRTCWSHNCPSEVFDVALDGTNERLLIQNAHSGVFSP